MADRFVLFVDMLGFAALVKKHRHLVAALEPSLRSLSTIDLPSLASAKRHNPLDEHFIRFHVAINRQLQSHLRDDLACITFSDSAFVSLPSLPDIMGFARGLMWNLMTGGTPVRMGIGYGSFTTLRFTSDIAGTAHFHSTQFLGTGVVHAYEAEGSQRGLLISLHSSVLPFVNRVKSQAWLSVDGGEIRSANYVYKGDLRDAQQADARHRQLRRSVLAMRSTAPKDKQAYYDNTLAALDAMRSALRFN